MNFRQLDLNLLRVLAAIQATRSVTEAGKQLSLSQSATSSALARLRGFFQDELFVRSRNGLQPTQLCDRIAPIVSAHLMALESVVRENATFEPATSTMHWRLSLSDLGEMLFLPPLASALRTAMPRARLTNVSVAAEQVSVALETREIDFAIGILHPKQRGVLSDLLFREHYVAVSAPTWRPSLGRAGLTLSPAQLAASSFMVASPTATFHRVVEQMLTRLKLADRIVLRSRHFAALPDLVSATDLLAIVPEPFAKMLALRHQLKIWQLAEAPSYDVRLVWHASTARDPAHQWMRSLLRDLFERSKAG